MVSLSWKLVLVYACWCYCQCIVFHVILGIAIVVIINAVTSTCFLSHTLQVWLIFPYLCASCLVLLGSTRNAKNLVSAILRKLQKTIGSGQLISLHQNALVNLLLCVWSFHMMFNFWTSVNTSLITKKMKSHSFWRMVSLFLAVRI